MKAVLFIFVILIVEITNSQWHSIYTFEILDDGNEFRDLEITEDSVIYAAREYIVLRSFDLGLTWDTAYYNEAQGEYRRVMFVNKDTGYIVKGFGPGLFIRTTNGGNTWETVTPLSGGYSEQVNNIFYFDYNNLLFPVSDEVDGFVVITSNAGLTSQNYYTLPGEDGVADIYCFSNDSCIIIPGYPYGGYFSSLEQILLTTNGCEDWEEIGYIHSGKELQVPSPDAMYIRSYYTIEYSDDRLATRDTVLSIYTGGGFSELFMLNDSVGFAAFYRAGVLSAIYSTKNMGVTWEPDFIEPPTFFKINSIDCFDEENCYMIAGITVYNTSEAITGITGNLKELYIHLSPNPATEYLNLEFSSLINELHINTFNLIGEIVFLEFDQNQSADVSHLPPGIYFTEVINEHGRAVQKWVKM